MKRYIIIASVLALFTLLIPVIIYSKTNGKETEKPNSEQITVVPTKAETVNRTDETVQVFSHITKKQEQMPMNEYIIGVVAAEMPAEYEIEALKAQALAAMSYTRYILKYKDSISTDSNENQGYMTKDDMQKAWGENFDKNYKKIKSAVDAVSGLYLEYDGEPILAAYFAVSSGKTENAADIWGKEYKYLTAVSSDGDTLSPGYESSKEISYDELKAKAKQIDKITDASQPPVGEIIRTDTGSVITAEIYGAKFTGSEIRNMLELPSANFEAEEDEDILVFTTKGYGHGVGMSQYGADYMARQGADYAEILFHYYPNTQIVQRD